MKNQLVSIIIPVFNSEEYLTQAIESVLKQTYTNLELIIVNDGSTDSSEKIINTFRDKRIKKISQKNSGPSAARNLGISNAKGKYIAFIDADDVYLPKKIEEQVTCLRQTGASATYCDIQIIDNNSTELATIRSEGTYLNRDDFLAMLLLRQIIPAPSSLMINRRCFDKGLRYDERLVQSEDYKMTLDLALMSHIIYQPAVLYKYRRHKNNLSNQHRQHKTNERKVIADLGVENIAEIVDKTNFNDLEKNYLRARILYKIEAYKQALNILKTIKPPTCGSLFYLGNIMYLRGNYSKASAYFSASLETEHQRAETFNNWGCCLAKLSQQIGAQELFNMALANKAGYLDPKINLQKMKKKDSSYNFTHMELRESLTPYSSR